MKDLILKLVASDWKHLNGAVLLLRLFVGGLMLTHGLAKIMSFSALAATFPDPLGVGSTFSLALVVFAEAACSCLLILGVVTRLALIPLLINMLVIVLVIHSGTPFSAKELPVLYLGIYVVLFWSGAGKYSLDEVIRRKLIRRETLG